jgi:cytochrome c553
MKKLTVLSIIAASLLLVGCGDSATGAEAKAATETTTEAVEKVATPVEAPKSAATEAKEAAAVAVEKATEAVKEKAAEVKEVVAEKASAAVESTKAAAATAVAVVTEAVASGPDGKALYAKCAGCHGPDGSTKPMGKDSVLKGQSAADLETKMVAYKAGTLNAHGMGALMKGQVSGFSDADMKAVATYVSGL